MKAIVKKVGNKSFLEMKLSGEEVKLIVNEMKRKQVHTINNSEQYSSGTFSLPLEMLMEEDVPV